MLNSAAAFDSGERTTIIQPAGTNLNLKRNIADPEQRNQKKLLGTRRGAEVYKERQSEEEGIKGHGRHGAERKLQQPA